MDSNYFVLSKHAITIERFHICSWELSPNAGLIEFGCDIQLDDRELDSLSVDMYIPWLNDLVPIDLYSRLKSSDNSKFIFNDSISSTTILDGSSTDNGVVHHFSERTLCLLPVTFCYDKRESSILTIELNLAEYKELTEKCNIYFRFHLEPKLDKITTRKLGVAKSTVIYDIKINERRNLPSFLIKNNLLTIKRCFCFQIIPISYDMSFADSSHLKNIRSLEFQSFSEYLPNKKINDRELMVVFNQKKDDNFSFFNIYTREYIGRDQIVLAVFINLVCSFLFILPEYRLKLVDSELGIFKRLPFEVYFAFGVTISFLLYLLRRAPKAVIAGIRKRARK